MIKAFDWLTRRYDLLIAAIGAHPHLALWTGVALVTAALAV